MLMEYLQRSGGGGGGYKAFFLLDIASEPFKGQARLPALDRLSRQDHSVLKVVGLACNDQQCCRVQKHKVQDRVAGGLELVVEQIVQNLGVLLGATALDRRQWV